jgi:cyclopropane fatty-acyl-phospholipid synthase-like methyltransferase
MYKTYKEIFDKRAHLYHKAMQDFPHARSDEFALAKQYLSLKGHERVLDMPAGGGYLCQYMQNVSLDLVAMETCSEFSRNSPDNLTCKTLLGSFTDIPLPSNSLDRLICLAALHHVENPKQFFFECQRLLRLDGILVLADVEKATDTADFLNIFVNKYNSMGHEGEFWSHKHETQLRTAGLTVSTTQLHEFRWSFDNKAAMLCFCRNLFGIDKADDATLWQGIKRYLAPVLTEQSCSLRWQLRYSQVRHTAAELA